MVRGIKGAQGSAWYGLADYLAYQRREADNENRMDRTYREKLIENGDPECEQVIAALEQGWLRDKAEQERE